jgi:hypothetical protein
MTNPVDIEVYYKTHLTKAQALPKTSVLTQRVDPDLAIVNIETGMHVVREHALEIPVHFPLELHPKSSCAFTFGASRSPLRGEDEVLVLHDGASPHTPAFATQMP